MSEVSIQTNGSGSISSVNVDPSGDKDGPTGWRSFYFNKLECIKKLLLLFEEARTPNIIEPYIADCVEKIVFVEANMRFQLNPNGKLFISHLSDENEYLTKQENTLKYKSITPQQLEGIIKRHSVDGYLNPKHLERLQYEL